MAFAERLTDFLDSATGFAEMIEIDGNSGVCIFDEESQDAFNLVGSAQPSALIMASMFPYATGGDTARIRNTDYTIAGIYPDGTGMTRLVLKK